MASTAPLVNRVAKSGLITLDLAEFLPDKDIEIFDLKDYLVNELVLMEKPFRAALQEVDWKAFKGKMVGITCSVDTIVPLWAYMLVTSNLEGIAEYVDYGDANTLENKLLLYAIEQIDASRYAGAKVVVKGCGEKSIPEEAFVAITRKIKPVASSLMYGEPCSTVPVYKAKK